MWLPSGLQLFFLKGIHVAGGERESNKFQNQEMFCRIIIVAYRRLFFLLLFGLLPNL